MEANNLHPEINPGELPAPDEALHGLLERLVNFVEHNGDLHEQQTIWSNEELQNDKEIYTYLKDPLGSELALTALGQEEKIEDLKDQVELIFEDADPESRDADIEQHIDYLAVKIAETEHTWQRVLPITERGILRVAGFPDDVTRVFLFAAGSNPGKDSAPAEESPKFVRVSLARSDEMSGNFPPISHCLELQSLKENLKDSSCQTAFERHYTDRRFSHLPWDASDIRANSQMNDILGTNKIQVQEVEWTNKLIDIYTGETPED